MSDLTGVERIDVDGLEVVRGYLAAHDLRYGVVLPGDLISERVIAP